VLQRALAIATLRTHQAVFLGEMGRLMDGAGGIVGGEQNLIPVLLL
jgi:hypothetical protein